MRNMTTPQAILIGLALIAIAIASIPFSTGVIKDAHASTVQKIALCDEAGIRCGRFTTNGVFRVQNEGR